MKRLLFGFVLGFVINSTISVTAQEPTPAPPVEEQYATAGHDPHNLTVKDFVDALAEFDVRHAAQQPFFQPAYGATSFDVTPPTVYIFQTGTTRERQSTVIHEFLHIYYHERGMTPPEPFIDAEEVRQFDRLYGLLR